MICGAPTKDRLWFLRADFGILVAPAMPCFAEVSAKMQLLKYSGGAKKQRASQITECISGGCRGLILLGSSLKSMRIPNGMIAVGNFNKHELNKDQLVENPHMASYHPLVIIAQTE